MRLQANLTQKKIAHDGIWKTSRDLGENSI
jgi:hypothetical protein